MIDNPPAIEQHCDLIRTKTKDGFKIFVRCGKHAFVLLQTYGPLPDAVPLIEVMPEDK